MKKIFSFVLVITMVCAIFNVVTFADDNVLVSAVQEHNRICENYFHTDEEKAEAEAREQHPKLQPIGIDIVYPTEGLLSINDINNFLRSGYASEIGDVIEHSYGAGHLKLQLEENFNGSQNPLVTGVGNSIGIVR